ncbi:hypothetical protein H0H92_005891 [Tricholoma furcatifolium]|nr:hypothetical protein H0H92_005891 [Tricholoma furcatifolium]
MDPLIYLRKLLALLEALGGVVHCATLDSLASALEFLPNPLLVLIPHPRSSTSHDIKRRALALVPELAPASSRLDSRVPQPEDLDPIVVREVVGFRPVRKGGLRLERGEDVPLPRALGTRGARAVQMGELGDMGKVP